MNTLEASIESSGSESDLTAPLEPPPVNLVLRMR